MLHFIANKGKISDEITPTASLSQKEIEFLQLVCSEMAYKQIADAMNVGIRAVDYYSVELFKKLNVETRVGLVLFAIKNGYYKL
jgi:DNA-binding NarL/FixJ family response regulator